MVTNLGSVHESKKQALIFVHLFSGALYSKRECVKCTFSLPFFFKECHCQAKSIFPLIFCDCKGQGSLKKGKAQYGKPPSLYQPV